MKIKKVRDFYSPMCNLNIFRQGKNNLTDLLNEVQQVRIMGGERSDLQFKVYLGDCPSFGDCHRYCHIDGI